MELPTLPYVQFATQPPWCVLTGAGLSRPLLWPAAARRTTPEAAHSELFVFPPSTLEATPEAAETVGVVMSGARCAGVSVGHYS